MIVGTDFLSKIGISINFSTNNCEWYGNTVPLRDPWSIRDSDFDNLTDSFLIQSEDEFFGDGFDDSYLTQILDAKYEKIEIDDVIEQQTHLT